MSIINEPIDAPEFTPTPSAAARPVDQPVPMSFPAVLRNMGTPRFQDGSSIDPGNIKPRRLPGKTGKVGKQWVRRKENAQFTSNPHISAPTAFDMQSPLPPHRAWPQPLPVYIPRRLAAPDWIPPPSIHSQQRLSRRGVRKHLRSAGPYAEMLVRTFEKEIVQWLKPTAVVNPDNQHVRRRIGAEGSVYEVSHTHAQLVWSVPTDGFARYVIHAVSRFHGIVSYSKDSDQGERMTHILRPRAPVTPAGLKSLDTPSATATDVDSGSEILVSDQDGASERGLDALTEEEDDGGFVVVGERSIPEEDGVIDIASRGSSPSRPVGEAVAGLLESLELDDNAPRLARPLGAHGTATFIPNRLRSGSSPSRSPARRSRSTRSSVRGSIRNQPLRMFPAALPTPSATPSSFWEYVYA